MTSVRQHYESLSNAWLDVTMFGLTSTDRVSVRTHARLTHHMAHFSQS